MFKINNKDINNLSISKELINKLKDKELNYVEDVWVLKRINLKTLGFTNDEIKEIVISLQLIGLDLNKKKY
jgi:DNA-directed RNA polymerase alpha subunit